MKLDERRQAECETYAILNIQFLKVIKAMQGLRDYSADKHCLVSNFIRQLVAMINTISHTHTHTHIMHINSDQLVLKCYAICAFFNFHNKHARQTELGKSKHKRAHTLNKILRLLQVGNNCCYRKMRKSL